MVNSARNTELVDLKPILIDLEKIVAAENMSLELTAYSARRIHIYTLDMRIGLAKESPGCCEYFLQFPWARKCKKG